MSWETRGTVTVTNNSTVVTGLSTLFVSKSRVGDAFVGPDMGLYEITNIASDTVLSISPPYAGVTVAGAAYKIAPLQGYLKLSADRLFSITNTLGGTVAVVDGLPGWLKNNTPAPVTSGGTGAETASAARQNLGLKAAALLEVGSSAGTVAAGDDSRIVGAAAESSVAGRLSTKVETTDTRLSNSREWKEPTATQAEAEAGTETTRRAFTAQRVRQAIVAWFNGISGALGRTILTRTTAAQVRSDIGLGTAAIKNVGLSAGDVMEVGAFGYGAQNFNNTGFDVNDLPAGQRISVDGVTEANATAQNLPALGGDGTYSRSWHVECVGSVPTRLAQTATEVFGVGTTKGRTFTRVKHDTNWTPWKEVMRAGAYGWGSTTDTPISMDANLSVISGVYQGGGPDAINFHSLSGSFGTLTVTRRGSQIEQLNQLGSGILAIRNSNDDGVTWTQWIQMYHTNNLLNIGTSPASARAALELTGEWVDLRPYLKPGFYWNSARDGKNSPPRIRKLSCGRVELDGVVSFNETSGPTPVGVILNVPAPFRPPLTAGGLLFADTASPLAFGACNWIVTGEVEYSPPRVHGDVMFVQLTLPATSQNGALSINGIYWFT